MVSRRDFLPLTLSIFIVGALALSGCSSLLQTSDRFDFHVEKPFVMPIKPRSSGMSEKEEFWFRSNMYDAENIFVDARNALHNDVKKLLLVKDFKHLENFFQVKKQVYYGVFQDEDTPESYYYYYLAKLGVENGHFEELIQQWLKAYPHSVRARMALARYYHDMAWKMRGDGFAYQTIQTGANSFASYMAKASTVLKEIEQQPGQKWPEFYTLRLRTHFALPSSRKEIQEDFMEGVKAWPDCIPLYQNMAILLLPRWYGEPGDLLSFANWAADAKNIGQHEAGKLYGIIAKSAITIRTTHEDFLSYQLPWPYIKSGMGLSGLRNIAAINAVCWMAVAYRDKPTAKSLFNVIGEYSTDIWRSDENFNKAKDWANGKREEPDYQIPESLLLPAPPSSSQ